MKFNRSTLILSAICLIAWGLYWLRRYSIRKRDRNWPVSQILFSAKHFIADDKLNQGGNYHEN